MFESKPCLNEWSKGPEDSLSGVILKSQIGSDFGPVDSFARQNYRLLKRRRGGGGGGDSEEVARVDEDKIKNDEKIPRCIYLSNSIGLLRAQRGFHYNPDN
ncbi:hypothetical protein CDAR_212411 [Caerostris darwini]|uniref:Uncharacterized protein n=1 Tax=Caerostris darwini TaxID=1538125 RepID=A0AAV4SBW7_9ARAC|nr:hypothetical protein CDAR_212411 [Caerostris darwini]